MIKPELEFVYEAGGELEAPREIGKVVDGTRRIIPIRTGGYVKGPKISGQLLGNSADWQLTRPDGVTVADAIYAIETDDGALIQIRNKGLRHGRKRPLAGACTLVPGGDGAWLPACHRRGIERGLARLS